MARAIRIPLGQGQLADLPFDPPGRHFVAGWLHAWGLADYEPLTTAALLALWQADRTGTFIDVGANCGLYSVLCSAIHPAMRVIAIEPQEESCEAIRHVAAANAVAIDIEPWAASDRDGTATLHIPAFDATSSLEFASDALESRSIDVRRIDSALATTSLSLVKIDVEGHEAAVLRGAEQLIGKHRPAIVVELLEEADGLTTGAKAALDELHRLDYTAQPLAIPEGVALRHTPRDWIAWPEGEPPWFAASYAEWLREVLRCGPVT